MHHQVTKALYDFYSLDHKNDFFAAYLYLKHIDHFMYHVFQSIGISPKAPLTELDDSLQEMMQAYVQQIADASPTLDTSIYHGKVVTVEDALKLVTQHQDLDVSPPEQVVPFKVARDIVLDNPESIAVGECACRAIAENPCLPPPMEVCLFVGDPFASFIGEQNPKFHNISQEEAVKVIEDSHQRGFVHCAYFKKELGNRFVAICNCCDCCCVGIKMWNLLEGTVPILAPSGYVAEVSDECNGCANCVDMTCRFGAISFDEDAQRAVISVEKCMGCGVCEDVCPVGAISMRRDASKGAPLDLEELKESFSTT